MLGAKDGRNVGQTSVTVTSSILIANLSPRVAKFRVLAEGEDAQTYCFRDVHGRTLSNLREQWIDHLAPILTSEATEMFGYMDESERHDYSTIRTALFKHYRVTQESYHTAWTVSRGSRKKPGQHPG